MASTVDVAPSIGHGLLCTQLGIGVTPGYDAIDLRRMGQVGLQEGVHDPSGWDVGEHTPNAMSVDVESNVGLATVEGDSVINQGNYVVAPHSAVVTLDIAAAHASNPRLDQIILRAWDHTHDGLGANKATMERLTGTATSGATLDNRNGAASLPNNALRLADVLVPANSGTVTNANIRDRRRWAYGAFTRGIRNTGNITGFTANVFKALGTGTTLAPRLECSGAPVSVTLTGSSTFGGSSDVWSTGFWLNGELPDNNAVGPGYGFAGSSNGFAGIDIGFTYMVEPSAGSHTFQAVAMRGMSNTMTVLADSQDPLIFTVREMMQFSGNNGT